MQKYTLSQIEELAKNYSLNFDTLKRYRNDPKKLESKIIEKIVLEKEVTLEQFLTLFDSSIATRLEAIEREPYSSILPLKLAILEYENENGLFIDDEMFLNRDTIEEIRNSWWKPTEKK